MTHEPPISQQFFDGFADPEYRHAFADEHLTTFIPFQIRAIRQQRGWTQAELGAHCGGKTQGWISQLEDPNNSRLGLATLKALARSFDCILDVKFMSFRDYSDEQDRRCPGDLRVNTYDEDARMVKTPASPPAASVAGPWQPIETAPKEPDQYGMTPIIIFGFAPDETGYSPESREGFWSVVGKRWVYTMDPGWDGCPQPTHWMPMPEPPTR